MWRGCDRVRARYGGTRGQPRRCAARLRGSSALRPTRERPLVDLSVCAWIGGALCALNRRAVAIAARI
jgi:hypothetical protein